MRFVKIRDGVIIRKESLDPYHRSKYDPRGCHYYIAMYNPKRDAYDMYATSHYVDPAKVADVRNKRAITMRIQGASGLSTVYNYAHTKDIHGQRFKTDDLKRVEVVGRLTPYQEKRFKSFLAETRQKSFRKSKKKK